MVLVLELLPMKTMLLAALLVFAALPSISTAQLAKDDKEFADLLPKPLEQPLSRQMVLSARICARAIIRNAALAAIRRERSYSHVGGVLNLTLLSRMQDVVKYSDMVTAVARASARKEKVKLLPCSHSSLSEYLSCKRKHPMEFSECESPLSDAVNENNAGLDPE